MALNIEEEVGLFVSQVWRDYSRSEADVTFACVLVKKLTPIIKELQAARDCIKTYRDLVVTIEEELGPRLLRKDFESLQNYDSVTTDELSGNSGQPVISKNSGSG